MGLRKHMTLKRTTLLIQPNTSGVNSISVRGCTQISLNNYTRPLKTLTHNYLTFRVDFKITVFCVHVEFMTNLNCV